MEGSATSLTHNQVPIGSPSRNKNASSTLEEMLGPVRQKILKRLDETGQTSGASLEAPRDDE